MLGSLGQCNVTGTRIPGLKSDQVSDSGLLKPFKKLLVKQISFLGVTIELDSNGELALRQKNYIPSKLIKRRLLSGRSRHTIPKVPEGKTLSSRRMISTFAVRSLLTRKWELCNV